MNKIIAYEICKQNGKSKQCNFKNGLYNVWDIEHIKKVFNNGNGSISDFKKYVNNNKSLAYFEFINQI